MVSSKIRRQLGTLNTFFKSFITQKSLGPIILGFPIIPNRVVYTVLYRAGLQQSLKGVRTTSPTRYEFLIKSRNFAISALLIFDNQYFDWCSSNMKVSLIPYDVKFYKLFNDTRLDLYRWCSNSPTSALKIMVFRLKILSN